MSKQKLIFEYPGIKSDIINAIKKIEQDVKVLNKLHLILDVLHGEPVLEIIEKYEISQGTAYTWIHQWNEGGIEGLRRKKSSGGNYKLTKEQFIILDKIIQQQKLQTAKEVKRIIEVVFGVTYSIRQVERIMKKLDYSYTKPYQIYDKMPDDAEEQLRKSLIHIDEENFKIMLLDQTYCQNQDNSQKSYHKKNTKNIKIQPTDKISINAVGVQAINGKSLISFIDNSKTFEMMKFMITVTLENCESSELKIKLEQILNNEDLLIENILDTVNKKENYDLLLPVLEELSHRNKTFKKLFKRVKKNPLNFKTKDNKVLENLQKTMLLALFSNKKLQHELIMEKPIAMVLDNYRVHHAIVFTELCNVLNMDLIYLPPYSPKYNPIEQVWRTIKATISRKYITSLEMLKFTFESEFNKVVNNNSFWENWVMKLL